jgi:hypothetical protein
MFVKVPQALPEHAVPETLQVTPLPLESFATVAVKFRVWAISMLVGPAGASETEMAGGGGAFVGPPPQPHNNAKTKERGASFFIFGLPHGWEFDASKSSASRWLKSRGKKLSRAGFELRGLFRVLW